ncbi:hypothetical protein [Spiroplasma endosymbiont of Amphibalanus improvisus]|uniref:hypothetical protein n=1 Tax=Spiroplasma endosymbiont of Amphibalanus improvisus TaxID=3066327 RepID=UPI00313CF79E
MAKNLTNNETKKLKVNIEPSNNSKQKITGSVDLKLNDKNYGNKKKKIWLQLLVIFLVIGSLLVGISLETSYDIKHTKFTEEFSSNINMQVSVSQLDLSDDEQEVSLDDKMYILRNRIDPLNNQNIYIQERTGTRQNHDVEEFYLSVDYSSNEYLHNLINAVSGSGSVTILDQDGNDCAIPRDQPTTKIGLNSIFSSVHATVDDQQRPTVYLEPGDGWNDTVIGDDSSASSPTKLFFISNIGQLINELRGDFWRYDAYSGDVYKEYELIVDDFFHGAVWPRANTAQKNWLENQFLKYSITDKEGNVIVRNGNLWTFTISELQTIFEYGPECFEWTGNHAKYNTEDHVDDLILEANPTDGLIPDKETDYLQPFFEPLTNIFDITNDFGGNEETTQFFKSYYLNYDDVMSDDFDVDSAYQFPVDSQATALSITSMILGGIANLNYNIDSVKIVPSVINSATSKALGIITIIAFGFYFIYLIVFYRLQGLVLSLSTFFYLGFILLIATIIGSSLGLVSLISIIIPFFIIETGMLFLLNRYKRERYVESLLPNISLKIAVKKNLPFILDSVAIMALFGFALFWCSKGIFNIFSVYLILSTLLGALFVLFLTILFIYLFNKMNIFNNYSFLDVWNSKTFIKNKAYDVEIPKFNFAKDSENIYSLDKALDQTEQIPIEQIIETKDIALEQDKIKKNSKTKNKKPKNKSNKSKDNKKISLDCLIEDEEELEIIEPVNDEDVLDSEEKNVLTKTDEKNYGDSKNKTDNESNHKLSLNEQKNNSKKETKKKIKKSKNSKLPLKLRIKSYFMIEHDTEKLANGQPKIRFNWYKMSNLIPILVVFLIAIAGIMFACNAVKIDDSLLPGTNFVFAQNTANPAVDFDDFPEIIQEQMDHYNEFDHVIFSCNSVGDTYEIVTNISSNREARHFKENVLVGTVVQVSDAVDMLHTTPQLEWDYLIDVVIALAITLAIIFIYVLFRLDWSYFITIFIVAISVLFLTISLSMILQLSITFSVVVAFLASILFSFSYSVLVSSRLNQFRKNFDKEDYNSFFKDAYEYKTEIKTAKNSIKRIKRKELKIRIKDFMVKNNEPTKKEFIKNIKKQYALEMSRKELKLKIKTEWKNKPKLDFKKLKKDIKIKWNEGITAEFIVSQKEKIKNIKKEYYVRDQNKNLLYKTANLTIRNLLWFNIGISILFTVVFIGMALFFFFSLFFSLLIGLLLSIWLPFILGIPIWVRLEKIRSLNNVKLNKYLDRNRTKIDEEEVKGVND